MGMKLSPNGARFIHMIEEPDGKGGCAPALQAYKCPAKVWTIGWGHTSAAGEPEVVEGMEITREDADAIYTHDIAGVEESVNLWAQVNGITLTQAQFDALVSFVFNEGSEPLESSTFAKWIKKGRQAENIAGAMGLYNKMRDRETDEMVSSIDLAVRRYKEARLFELGIYGKGIDQ